MTVCFDCCISIGCVCCSVLSCLNVSTVWGYKLAVQHHLLVWLTVARAIAQDSYSLHCNFLISYFTAQLAVYIPVWLIHHKWHCVHQVVVDYVTLCVFYMPHNTYCDLFVDLCAWDLCLYEPKFALPSYQTHTHTNAHSDTHTVQRASTQHGPVLRWCIGDLGMEGYKCSLA